MKESYTKAKRTQNTKNKKAKRTKHKRTGIIVGFIELDPIGFSAGDNNWYRFVANGPTGKRPKGQA
jgi:hypothetical protein